MASVHTYKQLRSDVTIFAIDHSVGRGGFNRTDDVQLIQVMINRYISTTAKIYEKNPTWGARVLDKSRRQIDKLAVDGRCGPVTLAAILAAQRSMNLWRGVAVDGRIDPIREGGASQYQDGTVAFVTHVVKNHPHRIMNSRFNSMYLLAVYSDFDPNPPWNVFLLPDPLKSSLLRSSIGKSVNALVRLGKGSL